MSISVVHIVAGLSRIDFGIWNSAVFGAGLLRKQYGHTTYVINCSAPAEEPTSLPVNEVRSLCGRLDKEHIQKFVRDFDLKKDKTVIVSHGCWLLPTRVGYYLSSLDFKWVYVPHGMLEPWSLSQGRVKKWLYLTLFEKRFSSRANGTRAVSVVEKSNLERLLGRRIDCVENGVAMPATGIAKSSTMRTFLFMARLHYKKGILPLVKAWQKVMADSPDTLVIAGPDEGELDKIGPYLQGNVEYVGAVYGDAKQEYLGKAHYYLLPSHSEGFPTSVLEAMSHGAIPIISMGCNLPEVFENGPGVEVEPTEASIAAVLQQVKASGFDSSMSEESRRFVESRYSEPIIASKLNELYVRVLAG